MHFERFEITRSDATGDIKRRVICLAGRVSVFRARNDEELDRYINAIRGKFADNMLTVTVDDKPFRPEEHLLIGFEAEPLARDTRKVTKYLIDAGVSSDDIEPLLQSFGLDDLGPAPCAALAEPQQRILQLIAACTRTDQVLILNDPFAGVSEQWRETLAERLGEHAWRNRVIVVVVRLSERPEVWIENEYVYRIQLEKQREKTIGFGGGEFSSDELVKQLREELKKRDATQSLKRPTVRRAPSPASSQILTKVPKKAPFSLRQPILHAIVAATGVLIAAIVLAAINRKPQQQVVPETAVATNVETQIFQPGETPGVKPAATNAAAPDARASLLSRYPVEIRDAVLKAFREPQAALKDIPNFQRSAVVQNEGEPDAAPSAPDKIADTTPLYEPNTILDPSVKNEEELENQRQILRQHFMEAVERARERQARGE